MNGPEMVRREITRGLALTIAYKAAVDDAARSEVVDAIAQALNGALFAFVESGLVGLCEADDAPTAARPGGARPA
jgi:hypothetical protein